MTCYDVFEVKVERTEGTHVWQARPGDNRCPSTTAYTIKLIFL